MAQLPWWLDPSSPNYQPGGTGPSLPAPGSAGTGSFAPPPGYTYDPATGQYVLAPGNAYSPGSTPGGAPGSINVGPGQGTGLAPTSNYGITPTAPTAPAAPAGSGGGGGGGALAGGGGLTLAAPGPAPTPPGLAPQPSYVPPPAFGAPAPYVPGTFTAPSVQDALNNPGYQFSLQQGDVGLQNWAASKGTLNDSETANALEAYNQNLAQADYQNVFNNAMGMFQTNEAGRVGAYNTNEANRLQAYNTNYGTQYTDPYAIAAQQQTTGVAQGQTTWQDAYNAWLAQNQLLQGEQGLVIQGANAGL